MANNQPLIRMSIGDLDTVSTSLSNGRFATGELIFGKYSVPKDGLNNPNTIYDTRPNYNKTVARLYYTDGSNLIPIASEADYADLASLAKKSEYAEYDMAGNSIVIEELLDSASSGLSGHTLTLGNQYGVSNTYTTADIYPTSLVYSQDTDLTYGSLKMGMTTTEVGATVTDISVTLPAAANDKVGLVNCKDQSFAGAKHFNNETASASMDEGAVTIAGGLGVGERVSALKYGVADVITLQYDSTEESLQFVWG